VKDTYPGPGDGEPYYLTNVGGKLFFQAFRPDTGIELWTSDGTDAGTRLVRDIEPGPGGSDPYDFTDVGGVAYFVGYTLEHGTELWRSDGTEAGTHIVRDLPTGGLVVSRAADPFGGQLFFSAATTHATGSSRPTARKRVRTGVVVGPTDGHARRRALLLSLASARIESSTHGVALGRHRRRHSSARRVFFTRRQSANAQPRPRGSYLYFRAQRGQLWRTDGRPTGTISLTPDDT
jgi:ELWxxDGT repeat protein